MSAQAIVVPRAGTWSVGNTFLAALALYAVVADAAVTGAKTGSSLRTDTTTDATSDRKLSSTLSCGVDSSVTSFGATINVYTKAAVACTDNELAGMMRYLETTFDSVVNDDPKFNTQFEFQTSFCDRRRLEEEVAKDDTEDGLLRAELVGDRNLVTASDDAIYVLSHFVGDGSCVFCPPDDDDRRRVLAEDIDADADEMVKDRHRRMLEEDAYFYQNAAEMETALNTNLSTHVKNFFHWKPGHCLEGSDPFVKVHLIPKGDTVSNGSSTGSGSSCASDLDYKCCSPKNDLSDACSKTTFGDSWWCHESEDHCENYCSGVWLSATDPPMNCLSFWQQCGPGHGDCCEPYATCTVLNPWYSQCL